MIKVWFLFDNLCFAKINLGDRDSLIKQASEFFAEDGCGSLCAKDEMGGTLADLWLHGWLQFNGKYGVAPDQLEQWADKVLAEDAFHRSIA